MRTETKTRDWSWVFWIVAFLLGVLVFSMTWWHVLVLIIVSNITYTTSTTWRYR